MLTNRLRVIAENINGKRIADIGTDHAYIPIYMVTERGAEYAIASDIKPGPLAIAEKNIKKYGCGEKTEIRLGSGMTVLTEADNIATAVIAGMGGEVICGILAESGEIASACQELVLQPMNSQYELRKWLFENGYRIIKEDLAAEGIKIYNIIVVKREEEKKSIYNDDFELHLPPSLYGHELFVKLAEKKMREFKKIKTGFERAKEKDMSVVEKYDGYLKRARELAYRKNC